MARVAPGRGIPGAAAGARRPWKATRVLLACVLLALSAAVPILDRDLGVRGADVLDTGTPASALLAHDHLLCVAYYGNTPQLTDAPPAPSAAPIESTEALPTTAALPVSRVPAALRARAPPA